MHTAFTRCYQTLQSSAPTGVEIGELAKITAVNEGDIERLFIEGQLATASVFLKFKCVSCKELMAFAQRNGRHCLNCSQKFSKEAHVSICTIRALERREVEQGKMQQALASMKTHLSTPLAQPQLTPDKPYGLKKNNPPNSQKAQSVIEYAMALTLLFALGLSFVTVLDLPVVARDSLSQNLSAKGNSGDLTVKPMGRF